MKTTVEFNDDLLAEIKRAKARDGVSMKELVEEGLRLAIAVREQRAGYRFRPVVVGEASEVLDVDVNALVLAGNAELPESAIPKPSSGDNDDRSRQ